MEEDKYKGQIRIKKEYNSKQLTEKFADPLHRAWSEEFKKILEECSEENIVHWEYRSKLTYKQLPEKEKESYRLLARKLIQILIKSEIITKEMVVEDRDGVYKKRR